MARRKLFTRGRYLLGGFALAFGLCMVTGGGINVGHHNAATATRALSPSEAPEHLLAATDAPTGLNLRKRADSQPDLDDKRQGWRAPQNSDSSGSLASFPDEKFSDPEEPNSFPGSSLKSIKPGHDHLDAVQLNPDGEARRPAGERGLLASSYRQIGETLKPLFATSDRDLPEGERSKIPPAQKPGDYGYVRSEAEVGFPIQLMDAYHYVTMNEHQQQGKPHYFDLVTWAHTMRSSAESASGKSDSQASEFPASDVKFKMATMVEERLLIVAKGLPAPRILEFKVVAMRYASDLWDYEWRQASAKKRRNPKELTYFMNALDPDLDKSTIETLFWAVKAQKKSDDVFTFPGHVFELDTDIGTVILGMPFAQDVARLLIQHKATYGHNRRIVDIRFWKYHLGGREDMPRYGLLVTLDSPGEHEPKKGHTFDLTSSYSDIASSQPEPELAIAPAHPAGNQAQAANQPQAEPPRPAKFQVGGGSSGSEEDSS